MGGGLLQNTSVTFLVRERRAEGSLIQGGWLRCSLPHTFSSSFGFLLHVRMPRAFHRLRNQNIFSWRHKIKEIVVVFMTNLCTWSSSHSIFPQVSEMSLIWSFIVVGKTFYNAGRNRNRKMTTKLTKYVTVLNELYLLMKITVYSVIDIIYFQNLGKDLVGFSSPQMSWDDGPSLIDSLYFPHSFPSMHPARFTPHLSRNVCRAALRRFFPIFLSMGLLL